MLLSRSADTLRVAIEGNSDASEFHGVGSTWVSEDGEPVTIRFEWERRQQPVPSIEDCTCSPELASRLMAQILDPEGDQLENMLYVLSAGSTHAGSPRSSLLVN